MKESRDIEFCSLGENSGKLKETTLRTIVGFLNTDGGMLYIPMKEYDENLPDILKAQLEDAIAPAPLSHLRIDRVDMEEDCSLVMNIERGHLLPYCIRKDGISTDGVYVRSGSRTRKASEEEMRHLIIEGFSADWEDTISPIQNLSFSGREIPDPLIRDENGKHTKLGLILSDQNPYSMWISEFENDDSIPVVTEITGPLDAIFEKTMKKIESRCSYNYSIPYPMKATREMLLNAMVHRDYSWMAGNALNIYPDRIQISSIGTCTRPVRDSIITEGIKSERNPKLKRILEELLKTKGVGVRAALKDAKDNGFRIEFKELDDIFSVTIRRVKPAISPEYSYDLSPEYRNMLLMESDTPYEIERKSELDEVYSYIVINGAVTRREIEEMLEARSTKAYTLLSELVEKGRIVQEKKGRSSYYHLP